MTATMQEDRLQTSSHNPATPPPAPSVSVRRLALSLAIIAGFVNLVAFHTMGTTCAHMSGHFTTLGRLVGGDHPATEGIALIVALTGFWLGAGAFSTMQQLKLVRNFYRFTLLAEALLLSVAIALNNQWALCLMAAAMGLQNSFTSHTLAIKMRTTHVTGLMTDIPHDMVIILKDLFTRKPMRKNITTFLAHIGIPICFALGAGMGYKSANNLDNYALIMPILALTALALFSQAVRAPE